MDVAGVESANRLGEAIYDELQTLPESVSTKAKRFDPELRASLEALRVSGPEWYRVYGGRDGEGAVIVSQLDEPVEFHRSLSAEERVQYLFWEGGFRCSERVMTSAAEVDSYIADFVAAHRPAPARGRGERRVRSLMRRLRRG